MRLSVKISQQGRFQKEKNIIKYTMRTAELIHLINIKSEQFSWSSDHSVLVGHCLQKAVKEN
jgi:hypothetical protein